MGRSLTSRLRAIERPIALGLAAALVGVAAVPPLAVVARSALAARPGLLADPGLWASFGRSVALSLAVTGLAAAVGVPLGVFFARASIPSRGLLLALHASVAFLPPFLPALGWSRWFGAEGLLGSEASARLFFGPVGLILILAACFTPIVTALTALGVAGVDGSHEEAARLVARPARVAALVLVPLAAPAVALAALVVFALSFSELGVPTFVRVPVYSSLVFSRLGGLAFAPGEAAVLVLPLVALGALLLWVDRAAAGRRAIATLGGPRTARAPLFVGGAAVLASGSAVAAALVSLAPLAGLVLGTRGSLRVADLLAWMGEAPWNGLRAATIAAAIATAAALVCGHALARGSRFGRVVDGAAVLAFVLPSAVLGVGMIGAWNHPETAAFYGSFGILVVGYVARYAVVASRVFAVAVAQQPLALEEAAATVGAGYLSRLTSVVGGLGWRGLASGFALTLVFCLRDLDAVVLFHPPGGAPLSVRIFTLEANGPAAVVAGLAVVHAGMSFLVVLCGALLIRRRRA